MAWKELTFASRLTLAEMLERGCVPGSGYYVYASNKDAIHVCPAAGELPWLAQLFRRQRNKGIYPASRLLIARTASVLGIPCPPPDPQFMHPNAVEAFLNVERRIRPLQTLSLVYP